MVIACLCDRLNPICGGCGGLTLATQWRRFWLPIHCQTPSRLMKSIAMLMWNDIGKIWNVDVIWREMSLLLAYAQSVNIDFLVRLPSVCCQLPVFIPNDTCFSMPRSFLVLIRSNVKWLWIKRGRLWAQQQLILEYLRRNNRKENEVTNLTVMKHQNFWPVNDDNAVGWISAVDPKITWKTSDAKKRWKKFHFRFCDSWLWCDSLRWLFIHTSTAIQLSSSLPRHPIKCVLYAASRHSPQVQQAQYHPKNPDFVIGKSKR